MPSHLSLIILALLTSPVLAQNNQGAWGAPFNHNIPTTTPMDWREPSSLPPLDGLQWDGEDQDNSPTGTPAPIVRRFLAGHMALIPVGPCRGQVLVWNWMRVPAMPEGLLGGQHWAIVDVSSPTPSFLNFTKPITYDPTHGDIFCSGHAWTKDGDLLVAGGDTYFNRPTDVDPDQSQSVFRFHPNQSGPPTNSWWVQEPSLTVPRWYPTVKALSTDASGRDILLVLGGDTHDAKNSYEAFDPSGAPGSGSWQSVPGSSPPDFTFDGPTGPWPTSNPTHTCAHNKLNTYPRGFLLTSGKLFFAGQSGLPYRLNHTGRMDAGLNPNWEIPSSPNPFFYWYDSAFLYPNIGGPNGGNQDIVLRVGGEELQYDPAGATPCTLLANNGATARTDYCQASATDPAWNGPLPPTWSNPPNPMSNSRLFPNTVLLPDASVLAFSAGEPGSSGPLSVEAEIFNDDPSSQNTWRPVALAAVYRGYHSTGVLLPDGRVLVGGGENRQQWNGVDIFGPSDYEIFSPHYLTNGTQRPQFVNPPSTLDMKYNHFYTLSYVQMSGGVQVDRVVLMAPGSVTHHTDMHQRYIELRKFGSTSTSITFESPTGSKLATPGFYMLFLVTGVQSPANRRAPSNALWVNLQTTHPFAQ